MYHDEQRKQLARPFEHYLASKLTALFAADRGSYKLRKHDAQDILVAAE
jgi:hypothetical protein